MIHESEIILIFRAPSGNLLPTREFREIEVVANNLGPAYAAAFKAQANRQERFLQETK